MEWTAMRNGRVVAATRWGKKRDAEEEAEEDRPEPEPKRKRKRRREWCRSARGVVPILSRCPAVQDVVDRCGAHTHPD
jgi:hypothetical protein